MHIDHSILRSFIVLMIMIYSGTSPSYSQIKAGRISITDVSGSKVELTDSRVKDLQIEMINGCSLRTPIYLVKEIRKKDSKSFMIILSTGDELIGSIKGQISGTTDIGEYSLPWNKLKQMTLSDMAAPLFVKPPGLSAKIKLKTGDILELSGLLMTYLYSGSESNTVGNRIIFRETDKTRMVDKIDFKSTSSYYFVIPLELLRSLRFEKSTYQASIQLPNDSILTLTGNIGSNLLPSREFKFQGCDTRGIWYVPTESISNMDAYTPVSPYPVYDNLCVFRDYGPFNYDGGSTINGHPYTVYGDHYENGWENKLGKLTCLVSLVDGKLVRLVRTQISDLFLRQGESETRVEWSKLKSITIPQSLKYKEWNQAEIVLNDGRTLSSYAQIRKYGRYDENLVGVNNDAITMCIKYDRINRIEILASE